MSDQSASFVVSRQGSTAVVTITHPGRRNAISLAMWRELPALMAGLSADPEVRVVVITGHGQDFTAGADINELDGAGDTAIAAAAEDSVTRCPKPVIAAIEGYCLGGGCQLALAADLRVAAEDARFGIPPANLGLVYPMPGIRNLVDTIGPAWTKRLVFTTERIDAATALRIGLVEELTAPGGALPRALELAERIGSRSQLTVHAAKDMARAILDNGDEAAVTRRWAEESAASPDLTEGRAAFAEKREPRFRWRGRR